MYSGCSSDSDLITMVSWVEDAPDVMINFRDDPTKSGRMNCYNGESLVRWLNQPENTFARWKQRREDYPIEPMGHGGMPDPTHKYVKMYTGEYVVDDDIVDKLKRGVKYPVILDADYVETERIGNLRGEFGIGDVHGQLPGYRVYKLKTDKPLETEDDIVVEHGDLVYREAKKIKDNINVNVDEPEDFVPGLDKYLSIATEKERLSLENRILFALVSRVGDDSDVSEYRFDDEEEYVGNAKDFLSILYQKTGKDLDFLETQEFNDRLSLIYQIRDLFLVDLSDDKIKKLKKMVKEKYNIPMSYLLIEAYARWGDELDAGTDLGRIAGVKSPMSFDETKKGIKYLAAIVARSRIVANYDMTEYIDDGGILDYKYNFHYEEIVEQTPTQPDTFDGMINFYKNLPKMKIEDIKTSL